MRSGHTALALARGSAQAQATGTGVVDTQACLRSLQQCCHKRRWAGAVRCAHFQKPSSSTSILDPWLAHPPWKASLLACLLTSCLVLLPGTAPSTEASVQAHVSFKFVLQQQRPRPGR